MIFRIDDFNTLELTFLGTPTTLPLLYSFEYIEHVQQYLPGATIVLGIRDEGTEFIQQALYDGAPVICTLTNSTINLTQTFDLRVFGTPTPTQGDRSGGYSLSITCILNYPKFFHAVSSTGYQGSVSDVLAMIGKECGLQVDVVQAAGSQSWYSYGRSYADMVQYLVDRCYISQTSLPAVLVKAPGILVVKDIIAEIKKSSKYELNYKQSYSTSGEEQERKRSKTSADTTYTFHDFRPTNVAGLLNSSSGYGNTFIQHSLQGLDMEKSKQVFSRGIANSELSKKIKEEVSRTAINYLPLNIGNTYNEFYEAYAKNIRLRDLFSNVLKVVSIGNYSKIGCLDNVELTFDQRGGNSRDQTYAGKYIVVGKTINITKSVYRELLTVANYGRSMENDELV